MITAGVCTWKAGKEGVEDGPDRVRLSERVNHLANLLAEVLQVIRSRISDSQQRHQSLVTKKKGLVA